MREDIAVNPTPPGGTPKGDDLGVYFATATLGIVIMAINTVIRTFDKVALGLFNTAVLGGLPLVAAALLVGSFAS